MYLQGNESNNKNDFGYKEPKLTFNMRVFKTI